MPVTCPFCPLRCDDLVVQVDRARVSLRSIDCPLAAEGFQRLSDATESAIAGATSPPAAEIDAIAARIAAFHTLSISGTIVDIHTARSAIRFAEAVGGVADVLETRSTAAVRRAVERDGLIAATLGELRQRADSVVFIGDPTRDCPRLFERFLSSGPAELVRQRRFLSLGEAIVGDFPSAQYTHFSVGDNEVHHRLAEARMVLRHGRSDSGGVADWLREGTYTGWLWSSDALDPLAASALVGLIGDLNRDRRAVAVSLSGDATFRSVATWLSGFSGPVNFAGATPELCEKTTAAALPAIIWLQPYPTAPPPPVDDRFLVVIGMADAEVVDRADFYLPASVPGIDVSGSTVRGDGTVCLPLHAARSSALPSAATRLAELATVVAQRRLAAC